MPADQCRECRLLAANGKSLQQHAVTLVLESLGPREPVNVPDNDAEPTVHHGGILANDACYLYYRHVSGHLLRDFWEFHADLHAKKVARHFLREAQKWRATLQPSFSP